MPFPLYNNAYLADTPKRLRQQFGLDTPIASTDPVADSPYGPYVAPDPAQSVDARLAAARAFLQNLKSSPWNTPTEVEPANAAPTDEDFAMQERLPEADKISPLRVMAGMTPRENLALAGKATLTGVDAVAGAASLFPNPLTLPARGWTLLRGGQRVYEGGLDRVKEHPFLTAFDAGLIGGEGTALTRQALPWLRAVLAKGPAVREGALTFGSLSPAAQQRNITASNLEAFGTPPTPRFGKGSVQQAGPATQMNAIYDPSWSTRELRDKLAEAADPKEAAFLKRVLSQRSVIERKGGKTVPGTPPRTHAKAGQEAGIPGAGKSSLAARPEDQWLEMGDRTQIPDAGVDDVLQRLRRPSSSPLPTPGLAEGSMGGDRLVPPMTNPLLNLLPDGGLGSADLAPETLTRIQQLRAALLHPRLGEVDPMFTPVGGEDFFNIGRRR